jgi:small conductance mechanosensitive channel
MSRLSACLGWVLGLILLLTAMTVDGRAQTAPAPAEPPAPTLDRAEAEALIKTLEDPQAREQFLAQLRSLMAATAKPPEPRSVDELSLSLVELMTSRVNALGRYMVELSALVVDLPDLADWLLEQAIEPSARAYWLEVIGKIALVMIASMLAYRLVRHLIMPTMRRLEQRTYPTLAERLPAVLIRGLLRLLPIAAFWVTGRLVLPLVDAQFSTVIVAKALIHASVTSVTLLVAARVLLSPNAPNLRLVGLSDELANYFYSWLKRFIYLIAYSYVLVQNELFLQIPTSIHGGIVRLLGAIVAVMLIVFVLQNRRAVAEWLRGNGKHAGDHAFKRSLLTTRGLIADIWPVFAIFYVLSTYLIWAFDIPGGFALLLRGAVVTTLLLAVARPLAYGIKRLLERGLSIGPELSGRYPALQRRVTRYCSLLQGFTVSIVYFLILLALVHVWGIDLFGWLASLFSDQASLQLQRLALVVLITWGIWELISLLIENYLDAIDQDGARIERSGRARTLLPLLRTFLFVVISIVVALTTLSTLGIDITPLLAAAGVIGIAIGFGSQKLVQDIINGLFILFQDTIAVGDVVEVAGHAGSVERISVRTICLRDFYGDVHTIPFSEVATIKNRTKDFSYAVFDVAVAYREDVDQVMEMVRQIGAELEAEPEFGQYMLEPIEVLGVEQFTESAIIVKARIKTKAMKQWYLGRAFNRLLKIRFDQVEIEIPFPYRTVLVNEGAVIPADQAATPTPAETDGGQEGATPPAKPLRVVRPRAAAKGSKGDDA